MGYSLAGQAREMSELRAQSCVLNEWFVTTTTMFNNITLSLIESYMFPRKVLFLSFPIGFNSEKIKDYVVPWQCTGTKCNGVVSLWYQ